MVRITGTLGENTRFVEYQCVRGKRKAKYIAQGSDGMGNWAVYVLKNGNPRTIEFCSNGEEAEILAACYARQYENLLNPLNF